MTIPIPSMTAMPKMDENEKDRGATIRKQSHARTHIILRCPRCKTSLQMKRYGHYRRKNYRCPRCKFPILSEVKSENDEDGSTEIRSGSQD